MSRIAVLTLYATGHLNPSIVLGRALSRRGHDVTFFNVLDTSEAITSAGLGFVPFALEEFPSGAALEITLKIGDLSGTAAFKYYLERMSLLFRTSFEYLPELLRRAKQDLLIVDQAHYGGSTIAEHLNLPFVSLANALLLNREDIIPPPIMLWGFDDSQDGIERNRKGWLGIDHACSSLLSLINEQRSEWGLPESANLFEDSFSNLAQICQHPEVLDFPRRQRPASLHFVGQLRSENENETDTFPWEWFDGRPVIYASCGTLQNRLEHLFQAIIDACAPLNAQTVIALGKNGLAPDSFGEIPKNIKLVPYAPQTKIIARSSACIFHGGMNTALDCLAAGVPMVTIPIASEQPGIAMRLERLGVSKVIPLVDASAEAILTATQQVLTETSYRQAAEAIAQTLANMKSANDRAAELVEGVLQSVDSALAI